MTSEAGHVGGTVTSDYSRICLAVNNVSADHAQFNRSSVIPFLG